MAAITVRDLDEGVKNALRVRAARNGRSMEAEVRQILTDAAQLPTEGLAAALTSGFAKLGGVDLEIPPRTDHPRGVDLAA